MKKLLLIVLVVALAFTVAGFVKVEGRTGLSHLDRALGIRNFQSAHNSLFRWLGDGSDKALEALEAQAEKARIEAERALRKARDKAEAETPPPPVAADPTGKAIREKARDQAPMGELNEDDEKAIQGIIEQQFR